MSLRDIAGVLADRAQHARIPLAEPMATRLVVYYQVLSRWNRKINLTSLADPDEAVDRLLLEPVGAARWLPTGGELIDLGSGGGSPAIPLALATGARNLVMVESRVRKAAFLREVLRELGMPGTVESRRFEELPDTPGFSSAFGLVSVRAVRLDDDLFATVSGLLRPGGVAALFRAMDADDPPARLPPTLQWLGSHQLIPASHSALTILQRSAI